MKPLANKRHAALPESSRVSSPFSSQTHHLIRCSLIKYSCPSLSLILIPVRCKPQVTITRPPKSCNSSFWIHRFLRVSQPLSPCPQIHLSELLPEYRLQFLRTHPPSAPSILVGSPDPKSWIPTTMNSHISFLILWRMQNKPSELLSPH